MTPIEAALADIESLKPGETLNYTIIAKKHGIDRNTLSRRHRGVQASKTAQYENQQLLNNQQTKALLNWIEKLTDRGLYPTHEMLRNWTQEITGIRPGKQWPTRFLKKHNNDLIARYTTGIDSSRKRADSAYKYALYFELLARKKEKFELRPEDTYNMDEKGFLIGVLSKGKRIFSKQKYEQGGLKQRLQDGNREWITTIACICADGTSLSPGLIYQAVSSKIQDSWLQDFTPGDHHCFFASSSSGWTNYELGFAWLKDIFDRETKEKAGRRWRLLILDGHGSHLTPKFIDFCDRNRILLAVYPPHSTHSLQPLDVGIFGPLSLAYSTELEAFLHDCQGLSHLTKRDFFRLFWPSWKRALSEKNIESAWKSVGLWPWNPEIVLKRFTKKEDSRPSSSESSRSVLGAEDWRRIERLLKQVVTDVYDQNTRKLSSTMHNLSTENILLKLRCQGLERALLHEKKKRQRGKPLQFQLQAPEDGNAVFYSPNKVQEARMLQIQKEKAIEDAKISKEAEKQRKRQEKEAKQQSIENNRRIKAYQKELKVQEAERKKRQREDRIHAKAADLQLQDDFQKANKERKLTSRPSKPPNQQDISTPAPKVAEEAPLTVNRRGRQIRLPQRFRDL